MKIKVKLTEINNLSWSTTFTKTKNEIKINSS